MRTPITRFERAAGIFITVVIAILTVGVFLSGQWNKLFDVFRERFVIYAVGDDGYGAAVGSPVKVRDVEVGSVTEVALVDDPSHPGKPVRITMRLQPAAARFLNDRTVAVIIRPPFGSGMPPFGTSAIELRTEGSSPLAPRSVLAARGQASMLEEFSAMTKDVNDMRGRFSEATDEMKRSFAELRALTVLVQTGDGMAARMMKDPALAQSFATTLDDTRHAAETMRQLANEANKVTRMLPGVVDDAKNTAGDARALMAKLNATLDAVPAMIAATERTLKLAEELTETLKVAAGYAPELARKVDSSIDEANRLVEAAQKNILLRGNLPERPTRKTDALIRPPVILPPLSSAK